MNLKKYNKTRKKGATQMEFKKAVNVLTKQGICLDVRSSELNPNFLKYDGNDFWIIPINEVMNMFNEVYTGQDVKTYVDIEKELIPVDVFEIKNYYTYKNIVIDNDSDIDVITGKLDDIDVIIGELDVYLDVYSNMYSEVNVDSNLDYEDIKQIMINNYVFSDGSKLVYYNTDNSRFKEINKKNGFVDFKDAPELDIKEYYNKLVVDLINISDLLELYNKYWDYEELYKNRNDYLNIRNIIRKFKNVIK